MHKKNTVYAKELRTGLDGLEPSAGTSKITGIHDIVHAEKEHDK